MRKFLLIGIMGITVVAVNSWGPIEDLPIALVQKAEAAGRLRTFIKNIKSAPKKPESSQNSAKPFCSKPSKAKWICGAWSTCKRTTNRPISWIQTRTCTSDPSNKCQARGEGPTTQTCTPSAYQQKVLEDEQQQEILKIKESLLSEDNKRHVTTNYDTMTKNLSQMDSKLPSFEGATSLQLFQLASQYSEQVSKMQVYNKAVLNNSLQHSDMAMVNTVITSANAILKRFDAIAGSAIESVNEQYQEQKERLQRQQEINYQRQQIQLSVPESVVPQFSQQDHDQMCQRERRKAASLGITSDSSWMWHMVDLGCTSAERACEVMKTTFGNTTYARCQGQ